MIPPNTPRRIVPRRLESCWLLNVGCAPGTVVMRLAYEPEFSLYTPLTRLHTSPGSATSKATPTMSENCRRYRRNSSSRSSGRGIGRNRIGAGVAATAPIMRDRRGLCLVVRAQFEQEQLPPQAQPPEVDALDASLLPTTAKVENIALVLVLSQSGQ